MRYRFQCAPYQYPFQRPLHTSYGVWQVRSGAIVQLTTETGQAGWGEIAPIPWFGSETLEQALDFCRGLPEFITAETVFSISNELPACQFGFESALQALNPIPFNPEALLYSRLLPAGRTALQVWPSLWQQGYRTFKWKIGVAAIAEELALFEQLLHALPPSATLRLDANAGLTLDEADCWLQHCDCVKSLESSLPNLEYLEQPLPPAQLQTMLELGRRYTTPIALDESVATLHQLQRCHQQGWSGIVVIKPAIAGSPARLRQFCQTHSIDAVFSTAFETAIGRHAGLSLAAELGNPDRSVGYDGTVYQFDYFKDRGLNSGLTTDKPIA